MVSNYLFTYLSIIIEYGTWMRMDNGGVLMRVGNFGMKEVVVINTTMNCISM